MARSPLDEHIDHYSSGESTLDASFAAWRDARCRSFLEEVAARGYWTPPSSYARVGSGPDAADEAPWLGMRTVNLMANQLVSFEHSGITAMVDGNRALTHLLLQGNDFGRGAHLESDIAAFARALGRSTVRSLNLSTNRLGNAGIAAFFDALPREGTTLQSLYLSVNIGDDETSYAAARSIARFLQTPTACRGLQRLHLNGNYFRAHGVRTIVHGLLGSRRSCTLDRSERALDAAVLDAQAPNRCLVHFDLLAAAARDGWSEDVVDPSAALWEAFSLLRHSNWPVMVKKQCDDNMHAGYACRRAALRLFTLTRLVGCRARDAGGDAAGSFPLLRLPLELRTAVVEQFRGVEALSPTQVRDVLRYSVSPSTIGYGFWHTPPSDEDVDEPGILVPPWSWAECFAHRSPPQNWHGVALDYQRANPGYGDFAPDCLAFWECTGTDHAM